MCVTGYRDGAHISEQNVCHKAASPIRFPPTVALTPVVARSLFGRRDV